MSLVNYNGVTLPYPFHTSFHEDFVYDSSNTDMMYHKFDITVQAVINTQFNDILGDVASEAVDAADIMNKIRRKLREPRKRLIISCNGLEILPHGHSGQPTVDARNGPLPQAVNILQLTNETFLITFQIIAHYYVESGTPKIVSNRWTEEVAIDNNNYSTRTRRGTYVIRSDAEGGEEADTWRSIQAIVGVPDGFLRESSTYTLSRDGLSINYSITDKEVFLLPPAPAFTASGYYAETITKFGTYRIGECSLSLTADKRVAHGLLLQRCVEVVAAKVLINPITKARQYAYVDSFAIRQDLYSNSVSATLRARMGPSGNAGSATARVFTLPSIDFKALSVPPRGSEPGVTPPYRVRGTAGVFLRAANYYDPGSIFNLSQDTGLLGTGTPPGTGRGKD